MIKLNSTFLNLLRYQRNLVGLMNASIVRKMTGHETGLNIEQHKGRFINPRIFILDSLINLFKYKTDLLNAISLWMQIHPLLQSKIKTLQVYDKRNNEFLECGYFERASEEKIKSHDNVIFLRFKSIKKFDSDKIWKLLLENELISPLDAINGLLWRIKLIELDSSTNTSDLQVFKYGLIFTAHHSITDGRNAFAIILELIELIEHVYIKKINKINEESIKIAIYETNFENDPRNVTKHEECYFGYSNDVQEDIIMPDCLKPNDKSENVSKDDDNVNYQDSIYVDDNEVVYITANDIIRKRENHYCGFRIMCFNEENFLKLLTKCKQNKVKITGCLEVIISIALYKTLQFFSNECNKVETLKYKVTINLRNHFDPPIDIRVMGLWIYSFKSKISLKNLNLDENNFWKITIWKLINCQCDILHEFLESKIFIKEEFLRDNEDKIYKSMKGYRVKDVGSYFALTNIGQMESKPKKSFDCIKINEYYSVLSFLEDDFAQASFNSMCTIHNNLYWALSYNKKYFKEDVIDYWCKMIIDVFEKLIN